MVGVMAVALNYLNHVHIYEGKCALSAASLPDSMSTGASLWLPIHLAHSATQFLASEAGQTITA